MTKLKDVLAEHKKVAFANVFRGKSLCLDDCPACAQSRLMEWLEEHEIADPITHEVKGYWVNVEEVRGKLFYEGG